MAEIDLNTLIIKAQQGDETAMEDIVRFFRAKVMAISREYFLVGAGLDDIIQEGMIGLFKAVYGYNPEKNHNFGSFASLCIERQIQSAIKNANSKKNSPLNSYVPISQFDDRNDDEETLKLVLVDDESDIEQNYIDRELNVDVKNRIKTQLSAEQFKLLKMFLNGKSYVEMAEALNITTKQVDNNLQAIKRILRSLKGEIQ